MLKCFLLDKLKMQPKLTFLNKARPHSVSVSCSTANRPENTGATPRNCIQTFSDPSAYKCLISEISAPAQRIVYSSTFTFHRYRGYFDTQKWFDDIVNIVLENIIQIRIYQQNACRANWAWYFCFSHNAQHLKNVTC